MKNFSFGFSTKGFVVFILAMIPNIIWILYPPANDVLAGNSTYHPILDIIMNISQWIMVATLIFFVNKTINKNKRDNLYFGLAVFFIMIYYGLWILYYIGAVNPWMFISMATFPTLYFIFAAYLIKNYIAVIPSIIFGITHVLLTILNYLI